MVCHLQEHQGSSVEEAQVHVTQMATNKWKHLYKEYLASNPFSMSFKKASIDAARMVHLMYNYHDNLNLPSLEDYIQYSLKLTSEMHIKRLSLHRKHVMRGCVHYLEICIKRARKLYK